MKNLKKLSVLLTVSILPLQSFAAQPQPLNVYTYDSFSADWGAGPQIKNAFEKAYPQCQVNYTSFDNNGTLFNRVRLEGKKLKADIVLGLDQHQIDEAEKLAVFVPNKVDLNALALPLKWQNQTFLPYDFAEYAFIYDKNKLANPPKSFQELINNQELKILYQDPRTSSIGRGLLLWLNQVYPNPEDAAQAWQTLQKHTVTVTKGWTEAYGAFLKGEGDLVLSENTSPIYHRLAENKTHYAATDFPEGGVLQIEVVAKTQNAPAECSDAFLNFLLTPQAQADLAKKNVMLPVIKTTIEPHIDALVEQTRNAKIFDTSKIDGAELKKLINQWQKALSQ